MVVPLSLKAVGFGFSDDPDDDAAVLCVQRLGSVNDFFEI